MRRLQIRALLRAVTIMGLLCLASAARAQPSADQVLTDLGYSPGDKQKVLGGDYVSAKIGAVSERDLTFAVAFLVKLSPDAIVKEIMAGNLITADPQVKQYGKFAERGSLADLAELQVTAEEASALLRAEPGEKVNLSAGEMAGRSEERRVGIECGSRGRRAR